MAARGALLKYMRVNMIPRNPIAAFGGDTGLFSVSFNAVQRRFSTEEVRGSFLDKSEVSDRVVFVLKNFQKKPGYDTTQTKIIFTTILYKHTTLNGHNCVITLRSFMRRVKTVIEKPHNDHLPLIEASRLVIALSF
ncbi:hypothetical protein ACOSP7_013898 [Xanthoceras sorbifolium]